MSLQLELEGAHEFSLDNYRDDVLSRGITRCDFLEVENNAVLGRDLALEYRRPAVHRELLGLGRGVDTPGLRRLREDQFLAPCDCGPGSRDPDDPAVALPRPEGHGRSLPETGLGRAIRAQQFDLCAQISERSVRRRLLSQGMHADRDEQSDEDRCERSRGEVHSRFARRAPYAPRHHARGPMQCSVSEEVVTGGSLARGLEVHRGDDEHTLIASAVLSQPQVATAAPIHSLAGDSSSRPPSASSSVARS